MINPCILTHATASVFYPGNQRVQKCSRKVRDDCVGVIRLPSPFISPNSCHNWIKNWKAQTSLFLKKNSRVYYHSIIWWCFFKRFTQKNHHNGPTSFIEDLERAPLCAGSHALRILAAMSFGTRVYCTFLNIKIDTQNVMVKWTVNILHSAKCCIFLV